jgi:prostaglandin-endoperoxide synthase 2
VASVVAYRGGGAECSAGEHPTAYGAFVCYASDPFVFLLPAAAATIGGTLVATSRARGDDVVCGGLGEVLAAASSQPAGRIGLFNTDSFLVDMAEKPSIAQGRAAELASYNDYRRLFRLPRVATFDEISSDPKVRDALSSVYRTVDDVEFYVGLFAQDCGPNDVLPPLVMAMVASDAFSQALTNPLTAPRVFNEQTFSAAGMEIIEETNGIADVVKRNVLPGSEYHVSFTRRDYRRA